MSIIMLLGFTVGIILALTGAGGGILAVPLLVFGAGLSMAEAGPIGLLAVGLAAALGALMGLKNGTVRYRAAALIAGAGIICSPLGLWLAQRSPNRPLTIVFSFVLLYVAVRVLQRAMHDAGSHSPQDNASTSKTLPPCQLDAERGKLRWTAPCARALALSGVLAGTLSGLLGVGGGFVMVPALQRYTDLKTQSIVATSLAVIALVSIAGVASSAASGHLQWAIAFPFAAGALGGMIGGRLIAARLSGPYLQKAFAIVSAAVAVALFIKAIS
ncbi:MULTISPECIES: sulfite exporter TauE/SafE family protein [unclassified Undibacterium]|uniref:sulfite exporter TauE/SafE family protein n=1 Tax=unclassified Undibacterium TaxID=2630295 RepID=UPI002AC8AE3D|nr:MULTISPECIES: sulfite exporter TauE/SafE family protein [unclassified Undibacterium]MEB0137606.1 sulfite exporter TauE/SafE family protein [Undibacterium sp. CCC2.1]MEB0170607.1 sulfite exporter TauE/SafE family protein [Undibacterium sp. CCC1.1]MEB0174548.1 sulfite exporter TauE/SafE family protein [Undibacterium sp. CCC3.4]MEB0213655.1 sulfite exporter TauE/SafE family protein [Undibacterium sp. 5I2]WPX43821.1 sulfite exporter TauE/SafE family protein [Undibacterium sp. CCC3.4]